MSIEAIGREERKEWSALLLVTGRTKAQSEYKDIKLNNDFTVNSEPGPWVHLKHKYTVSQKNFPLCNRL